MDKEDFLSIFIKDYEDPWELIKETSSHPDLCLRGISSMLGDSYNERMNVFLENYHSIINNSAGENVSNNELKMALYDTLSPMSERIEEEYKKLE